MNDKSTIQFRNLFVPSFATVVLLLLAGCDLHHSPDGRASLHYVQGSVSGLSGTVVLGNTGGDLLVLNANGGFVFNSPVMQGQSFNVTVVAQPQAQTCSVTNGAGVAGIAQTDNVQVTCALKGQTVGGTVSGLSGTVVLQNNGANNLTLNNNGAFTFDVNQGAAYNITVLTQPASQTCTVTNGSGTANSAAINNVQVTCATTAQTVGGQVSGLSGHVSLLNNGTDALSISSDGPFTFGTLVARAAAYNVTVSSQPNGQTCVVTHQSGVISTANVTDIQVNCANNAYTVGGILSGLSGTVTLQNNGADNFSTSSNGSFTLSTSIAQGAPYNVTVQTQPAGQTCVVTNGSGTMGSSNVTNVGVACAANATVLSLSAANLALSVSGLTEYGVSGTPSSGVARSIVVTNVGMDVALNVNVSLPTFPSGTTSSTTCSSTLAPASSCTITVTPGATPTSDGTNPCSAGTAPVAGAIQVSADNANTVSSNVVVLSYGCIYQGGYVYAFDDSTTNTASVGGKVVATSDQASALSGVIWSSNGASGTGGDATYDVIYGSAESSTSVSPDPNSNQVIGQVACDGAVDGPCNTNNIYVYYQSSAANAPINPSYYAAGLCKQTINSYSDWFLPAVCELGYGAGACGSAVAPTLQNMQSNLVDLNGLNLLDGAYWSSTELSATPTALAWLQFFANGGFATQIAGSKDQELGVRCARALTP